jgi:hypothetical protein
MIPVPLFDLTLLIERQTGGAGNREKTNPCGAVKLEITGNGPMTDSVPANCSFSAFWREPSVLRPQLRSPFLDSFKAHAQNR